MRQMNEARSSLQEAWLGEGGHGPTGRKKVRWRWVENAQGGMAPPVLKTPTAGWFHRPHCLLLAPAWTDHQDILTTACSASPISHTTGP